MASQGCNGKGGKKEKRGQKRTTRKEGGSFRVRGELLFRTREEAEAHLWAALAEAGDDVDNGHDEEVGNDDKGEQVDKGGDKGGQEWVRRGVRRGLRRKGTRGPKRGVSGARMRPGNPPPCKSGYRVCRDSRKGAGGWRATRADRANRASPPPSDAAPAGKVTFQVTYGWGAN